MQNRAVCWLQINHEEPKRMTESILTEIHDGYRVLIINRPDKMNALDRPTVSRLNECLKEAEADENCRALVITGAGRGFCAGADLSGRNDPSRPRSAGSTLEDTWNPLARRLHNLRMPTIAAVNGFAAGAGSSIALGCDIVIAAKSAKFLQAFAKIGLVPDAGGTYLLPNLAGSARARGMAMLAEPVPAETALAWGMIWQVVEDAALMDEAHKLAARMAKMPTLALTLIRKLLAAGGSSSMADALDMERDTQGIASASPDHKEGVAAFLEKRAPKFTGKAH